MSSGNVQQEAGRCLTNLWQIEESKRVKGANLIQKIIGKILQNPDNPKFRDLNLSKIHKKLKETPPAFDLLFIAGFVKSADGQRLQWHHDTESIQRLQTVHDALTFKLNGATKPNADQSGPHKVEDVISVDAPTPSTSLRPNKLENGVTVNGTHYVFHSKWSDFIECFQITIVFRARSIDSGQSGYSIQRTMGSL